MRLKHAYIVCLLFFILLCFILPRRGPLDIGYWVDWTINIKKTGIANAYTIPSLNYNPVFLYVFKLYGDLMPSSESINENINYLKIFVLLFDFAAVLLLMWWAYKNNRNFFNAFFILFNIAYLYNTLCWGQVDSIHTTLVFFSLSLAIEKKFALSMLLFLLALNTKTQSIFFFPILALLWLPLLRHKKELIKGIAGLFIVQVLLLLPFIINNTANHVLNNYIGVVDFNNGLSMNAYNFWHLILWDNSRLIFTTSDLTLWNGVTLKTWGVILFFAFAGIALFPLFIKSILRARQQAYFNFADVECILLTLALITLVFFFFPTQMHERYSHSAMLFTGGYFLLSNKWLMFLLLSFAYLMNLEAIEKYWQLQNYDMLVFDARLIASLFALVITLGILNLYKDYNFKVDLTSLKKSFNK